MKKSTLTVLSSLFLAGVAMATNENTDIVPGTDDEGNKICYNSDGGRPENDGPVDVAPNGDITYGSNTWQTEPGDEENDIEPDGVYTIDGAGENGPTLCFADQGDGSFSWEVLDAEGNVIDTGTLDPVPCDKTPDKTGDE